MFARALIVLLVVLNAGVAVWWTTRRTPVPPAPVSSQAPGVARLALLAERPPAARPVPQPAAPLPTATVANAAPLPADVVDAPAAAATPDSAPPTHCYAFGPFADAAQVATARARLQPKATRIVERSVAAIAARGWRVWVPPQADRDVAQALATRITSAGFTDLLVVGNGEEANSIALGRYGSELGARTRESALRAAGFADAIAAPLGGTPAQTWLDVAASTELPLADERRTSGAAQSRAIDCATVR